MTSPDGGLAGMAEELRAARGDFLAALAAVPPERREAPGLIGEWSARELIAHLGYWAGHSVEAIHRVEQGQSDEFDADGHEVEERNATVARVARQASMETVRAREEASVQALLARLERLDPELLDVVLPDGGTLADQLRVDGPEHYAEHAADLRRAAG